MTISCQSTPVNLTAERLPEDYPDVFKVTEDVGVKGPECKLEDNEGASGSSTKESSGQEKIEGRTGSSTAPWYHKESHWAYTLEYQPL